MTKTIRIAIVSSVFFALAGCGAKGPLILPEKAVPIEAPIETPADEPTDNTPQIETPATTPAEEPAEDADQETPPPATDE